MTQKKEIYKETFKHTGYWNYKELYNFMFGWFKSYGYKLQEELYNEKILSNGKEVVINWNAHKKVTDYFKFHIRLEWHILGMKDAEVEIDGQKTKTNKGEVEIKFIANLNRDYEQRWEDKPFWKFMRGLYEAYIIRKTIDEYEDDIEDEVKELIHDCKAFLRIPGR